MSTSEGLGVGLWSAIGMGVKERVMGSDDGWGRGLGWCREMEEGPGILEFMHHPDEN